MEGGALADVFERFINTCLERGVIFQTLSEVAHGSQSKLTPTCEIEDGFITGRAGRVAMPGVLVESKY
jgi:hypothetical protein